MIFDIVAIVLSALGLGYVLRLIWLEVKPPPAPTWDESVFDDLNSEDTWQ